MEKPIILFEGKYTVSDLNKLKKKKIWRICDIFENQLKEYFEIIHPDYKLRADWLKQVEKFVKNGYGHNKDLTGNWVYYPWNGRLIHTVDEKKYWQLRTNRNREIINQEEQKKMSLFTPGVLGLSIGGNMAVNLAYSGVGNNMKLADFDVISSSNLNRLKVSLSNVGETKIAVLSRQIYEINPYAKLHLFADGVSLANLSDFVNGEPKPDVIFDAIDDFEIKIQVRIAARKAKIPVIMLTNLGDNILIDVERYDSEKNVRPFNGLVPENILKEILTKPLTESLKQKFAVKIVDVKNIPKRALNSLSQINKTLVGRPQLMSTVTVGAGLSSFLCRQIALNNPLPSGRRLVALDKIAINH